MIISVGFRVNSINATRFRQWANTVLKEHLLRGYSINQRFERLEQRVCKTEEQIGLFVRTALPPVEGIFFDGQIFDAYAFASDLIRSAQKHIVLIDNYINDADKQPTIKYSEDLISLHQIKQLLNLFLRQIEQAVVLPR